MNCLRPSSPETHPRSSPGSNRWPPVKYNAHCSKCFQIFVAGPTSWNWSVKQDQIPSLREFVERSGINLYVHCRYTDNLFSSAVKPQTQAFIKKELKLCSEIGARGFVVHLYKYGVKQVVDSLKALDLPEGSTKIMLENPAINPMHALYNDPKTLYGVYQAAKDAGINVGVCVDTCHTFSSGVHFSKLDEMKEFFTDLIKFIPAEDLLIHLNDSKAGVGTGIDRHATLGCGKIWDKDKTSLKWLLDFIQQYKICTVLERNEKNGSIEEDLKVIRELIS